MKKSRRRVGSLIAPLVAAIVCATAGSILPLSELEAAVQQDVRSTLFRDADEALAAAQEARADVLAPKSFQEGMKHYREAERDLERGRDLNQIRRKLDRAAQFLRRATEATTLANVTLKATLAAHDDAEEAEAKGFAGELWTKATEKFAEAATKLEDGDVNGARRRASEAEQIFRDAELAAIKANYLNETWALLEQADKTNVDDRAPKTLVRAQELARDAEKQLTENRYDTDEPRSLAQEAQREARHALYLAAQIEQLRKGKEAAQEDYLLSNEEPLRRVAAALDIPVSFEAGLEGPTDAILDRIAAYQDTMQAVRSTLAGEREMVATLQARVAELQSQLGGVEEERSALAQRVEAQARLQQRFTTVERMFTRSEAAVLRDGDDVILRLYGLSFPVGRSTIEPQYFPLLTKVQQAISTFPGGTVSVEGHTDSFGGDAANLRLSQERADAVRQYLLANMNMSAGNVDAVGHGETRPVASNETREGRARNRRIDVVIHPRLDASF